jgi:hypothetical protein
VSQKEHKVVKVKEDAEKQLVELLEKDPQKRGGGASKQPPQHNKEEKRVKISSP